MNCGKCQLLSNLRIQADIGPSRGTGMLAERRVRP